jgi:hypothetical protein
MSKEAAHQHRIAAEHYGAAAAAHLKAAEAYLVGSIGEAASHTVVADGHAAFAEEAKLEAIKEHVDEYSEPAV